MAKCQCRWGRGSKCGANTRPLAPLRALNRQECVPRQQEGGQMERGGHLQLAAEGPLGLQGGLHGEWPRVRRPAERLCGSFLQLPA